jgi:hypothetical protein
VKVVHRTADQPKIEFDAELRIEGSLLEDQKTVVSLPDDRPMGVFIRVSPKQRRHRQHPPRESGCGLELITVSKPLALVLYQILREFRIVVLPIVERQARSDDLVAQRINDQRPATRDLHVKSELIPDAWRVGPPEGIPAFPE